MVMVVLWMMYQKGKSQMRDGEAGVIEPFTRQFFNQIIRTHFVGIDQAQLFGNEFQLIETLTTFMPFHINTVMLDHSIDRYRQLNNNGIQLVLSRSIEIYNLIYKITPMFASVDISQIRFVGALFGLPVNILTTQISVKEFGDLKGSGVTLNVGPKDSVDYFVAVNLLLRYQLTVGVDVFLTYYDATELVKHYGLDVQAAILTRTHPDVTILSLVNTKLTRSRRNPKV